MFRFLLSSASIFVLISATILPQAIAARLCEERMPVTLLSLFRGSESIYVGRYEKTEDGEPTEDTADYTVVPIKKHFTVSSALKGESRKMLTLEDSEYRYKNQEMAADGESEHSEEGAESEVLQPGDSVLLFLKKNEDSGLLEPTDFSDGIKKMTPEKLAAYEARIRELKGIFASEKPKYAHIVAWMIRSAEDPLTRWEGTFELLQSFQNMDWQDEQAKQAKEKPTEVESGVSGESGESGEYQPEVPKEFDTGDPNYAKSVTESQKLALTNILLNSERAKKQENRDAAAEVANGDRELIELVKRWGDSRVASHLVGQLRQDSTDAQFNSEVMVSIASILQDNELSAFSDEYANVQWESEEAEIPSNDQAMKTESEEKPQPAKQNAEAGAQDNSEAEGEMAADSKEQLTKKTYGQLRVELLAKFLDRAEKVIEVEQNKANAKARAAM